MRKAVLVGFYRSSNLGDLALTLAIEQMVETAGYTVLRHDFGTCQPWHAGLLTSVQVGQSEPSKPLDRGLIATIRRGAFRTLCQSVGDVGIEALRLRKSREFRAKRRALADLMVEAEVVILAGGNMLMDVVPSFPALASMYCQTAHMQGVPIVGLHLGIGPVSCRTGRYLLRHALSTLECLSVRDELSAMLAAEMTDARKVTLSADPVFSLPETVFLANDRSHSRRTAVRIGVCVVGAECFASPEGYYRYLSGMKTILLGLNQEMRGSMEVVLFSSERQDYDSIRSFHAILPHEVRAEIKLIASLNELVRLLNNVDVVIAGRMHSLIFAHRCLVPHFCVAWQQKVWAFANLTNARQRTVGAANMEAESARVIDGVCQLIRERDSVIASMRKTNHYLAVQARHGNLLMHSSAP
jgi:polysaccharide pyruvyl transferase WcaK-like protein